MSVGRYRPLVCGPIGANSFYNAAHYHHDLLLLFNNLTHTQKKNLEYLIWITALEAESLWSNVYQNTRTNNNKSVVLWMWPTHHRIKTLCGAAVSMATSISQVKMTSSQRVHFSICVFVHLFHSAPWNALVVCSFPVSSFSLLHILLPYFSIWVKKKMWSEMTLLCRPQECPWLSTCIKRRGCYVFVSHASLSI